MCGCCVSVMCVWCVLCVVCGVFLCVVCVLRVCVCLCVGRCGVHEGLGKGGAMVVIGDWDWCMWGEGFETGLGGALGGGQSDGLGMGLAGVSGKISERDLAMNSARGSMDGAICAFYAGTLFVNLI